MSGLTRSCGRQTAGSLRSGERSYDRYLPNDAKQLIGGAISDNQANGFVKLYAVNGESSTSPNRRVMIVSY